jgi:hypothetical protein
MFIYSYSKKPHMPKTPLRQKRVLKKIKQPLKKGKTVVRKRPLWIWIIILIPLIVAIMWVISILSVYRQIAVVYEQSSPTGVNTLLGLIFSFIITYSAFVVLEYKRR